MRNQLFLIMVLVLGASIFSACHIEKRVHRPGYHVQFNKSKRGNSAKIENSATLKNAEQSQTQTFIESDDLLASTEDPIFSEEEDGQLKLDSEQVKENNREENSESIIDGCETIVFNSGLEVLANVEEITPTEIKYRRCELVDGPLVTVNRNDVYKIIYSNGAEDIITDENTITHSKNTAATGESKLEVFSLMSMMSSIVGFFVLGIVFGPLAIIFGIIGLSRASNNPNFKGKGFAIAGIIIGLLVTIIMILYFSQL